MNTATQRTRFRAYQLQSKGASYSYCTSARFTLCEARYNEDNKRSILHELGIWGKSHIDTLHITSWDTDHCAPMELSYLLKELQPSYIEIPGYYPTSLEGEKSLQLINSYIITYAKGVFIADQEHMNKLENAQPWQNTDVHFNFKKDSANSNDNSSVILFRSGNFNVLSLGDIESEDISNSIASSPIFKNEVDIHLLSHHGADVGPNSSAFLDATKPRVAIALCNWSSQYGHPDQNVLKRLKERNIHYFSTKQGDVIIENEPIEFYAYDVYNFIGDGKKLDGRPISIMAKKYYNQ